VSEGDHAGRFAEYRRRCLLESLSIFLSGNGDRATWLGTERLVEEAQVHDEAWVSGIAPASQSPELRPGPPAHVRLAFAGAMEGPIVIGRDRLFGMGLLLPLDVPVGSLELPSTAT
jgi:CRISPR-associated protein Csb2